MEHKQTITRTASDDADFLSLVTLLDEELAIRDGDLHPFYDQFNRLVGIEHVVVCYADATAVGCGALRRFDEHTVEVKRMFVRAEFRGKGVGALILQELELWAAEFGYSGTVLETGKKQPEAIRLYKKAGYEIIQNFGPYAKSENSMCMKKGIK